MDRESIIEEEARKILVTLGGGDPDNITLKVLKALNRLELHDLEVKIIVGPANPHLESLKQELSFANFTSQILTDVKRMPSMMAWADLAISAGGSTCWELCFFGVPTIIIIAAENNRNFFIFPIPKYEIFCEPILFGIPHINCVCWFAR